MPDMTIEEEIEQAFHEWWNATDDDGAHISAYIMPIVNRVRAEALREAANETKREAPGEPCAGATFTAHAAWLNARADRIEQNSEGNGA